MRTNLSGKGSKWEVEVIVDPKEKPISKSFGSCEEAEAWRRRLAQGAEEAPAAKTSKKAAPKLKVVGDLPARKKG